MIFRDFKEFVATEKDAGVEGWEMSLARATPEEIYWIAWCALDTLQRSGVINRLLLARPLRPESVDAQLLVAKLVLVESSFEEYKNALSTAYSRQPVIMEDAEFSLDTTELEELGDD